jgi:hypothetical protein
MLVTALLLLQPSDQVTQVDPESDGQPSHEVQGWVPLSGLQRGDIRPVDVSLVGKSLLGQARLQSVGADAVAELHLSGSPALVGAAHTGSSGDCCLGVTRIGVTTEARLRTLRSVELARRKIGRTGPPCLQTIDIGTLRVYCFATASLVSGGMKMSVAPPAPGWWQASDGGWHPPETHPDLVPPASVAGSPGITAPHPDGAQQPPVVAQGQASAASAQPPEGVVIASANPTRTGGHRRLPLIVVACIVVAIAGIVAGVVVGGTSTTSKHTALPNNQSEDKTTKPQVIDLVGLVDVENGTGCYDQQYMYGIGSGESVTVTNQSGAIIGTTTLMGGIQKQLPGGTFRRRGMRVLLRL